MWKFAILLVILCSCAPPHRASALYGPTLVESAADAALYTNGVVLFAIVALLFKAWRNSNVEVRDSTGNSV